MDEQKTTFEGHELGREALEAWHEAKPDNAYAADTHFRRILDVYTDDSRHADLDDTLHEFGEAVAGKIDALVRKNDLRKNHPTLDRYTDYGRRIENVDHHPSYHEAGEAIYGSGLISAFADAPNSVGALARMYLSSYNGEAGHNCPAACTAGVVRVLQNLADDDLRERYLPGFLTDDYDAHLEGAQFLTEVQGGSDVGANATRALPADDGTYRIWGEKWFCSNVDADVFLMTARFSEDQEGTSGLGLFFVPRRLEDGTLNDFEVRRLKDKIGTRTMASAECDFRGAVAHHLGPEEDGFKNMMTYVINTSRLWNALACIGIARRAYVVAQTYAEYREAFGEPILQYPLVQRTLADLRADLEAAVSGSMHMARLQDRIDAGDADERDRHFFRMALNLNKVRTAKFGRRAAVDGIEILGGNGAIETFSVLPRLLRDAIVTENWEGTHNTLQKQVMRDMAKYDLHEGFFDYLGDLVANPRPEDAETARVVGAELERCGEELADIARAEEAAASLRMRPMIDRLARVMYAAVRVWERAEHDEHDPVDEASLAHFVDRHVTADEPEFDETYLDRIATLSGSV